MILFGTIMRFYDRKSEMKELERIYELSKKSTHLTVIVGRRRVGKTRLVEEFMRDKPHIYLFVSRKSPALLLDEFSNIIREFYGDSPHFSRWDDMFEYMFTHTKELTVIAIDEFQNFRYSSPEIFSILQEVYDRYRDRGNVHLIALGSYISIMKKIFQDSKEPLFGRATETIHLKGLSSGTILKITEDMGFSPEERIELYSIFGGLPKYYVMLEEQGLKGKNIEEILRRSFFSEFPLLREEVKSMLIEDFGANYSTYFSILEAISKGYMTFTAISDKTGIKRDSLSKYLQVLRDDFNLISSHAPITENKKTKRNRYRISDNLIDFWFRFIFSQSNLIESERYEDALLNTLNGLPMFTASKFEDMVRDIVKSRFRYETCGAWWSRKGEEIDIVAIDEKRKKALFGEVKWRNRKMSCEVLDELKRKIELTGLREFEKRLLLVSKSGFTEECMEKMEAEGIMHWDITDIVKMLQEKD
jgi:AAA+ ATPase superfamily predicted ATPase